MTTSLRLFVSIVTALALCKYCLAEWNSTEESSANQTVSCHLHGDLNNCPALVAPTDPGPWSGHFTRCPEELKHYCIHGSCRYIQEQSAPSCRCDGGFVGSRCEYLDLGWQIGERKQLIIIVCVVVGLVLLILLLVFICLCSHRRYRLCRRQERQRDAERPDTAEKLRMMPLPLPPAPPSPETLVTVDAHS